MRLDSLQHAATPMQRGMQPCSMPSCPCFTLQDKEGTDPNRVGGPTNPLLEGGGLSTIIGKGRDGDNSYMLNRLHTRR